MLKFKQLFWGAIAVASIVIGCATVFSSPKQSPSLALVQSSNPIPAVTTSKSGLHPIDNSFIDSTGKVALKLPKNAFRPRIFSEGLAAVNYVNRKSPGDSYIAYIDRTGKFIIPPQFEEAKPFSEGLAAVVIKDPQSGNGKWGYIDRTGKFIIPAQFDRNHGVKHGGDAGNFADGLAEVTVLPTKAGRNSSTGYIDRTGKFVIAPKFNSGNQPFRDGVAYVGIMYEPNPNLDVPEISIAETIENMEMNKRLAASHPNGFKESDLSPQDRAILEKFEKRSQARGSVYKGGAEGYIDRTGKFIWKKEYRD